MASVCMHIVLMVLLVTVTARSASALVLTEGEFTLKGTLLPQAPIYKPVNCATTRAA